MYINSVHSDATDGFSNPNVHKRKVIKLLLPIHRHLYIIMDRVYWGRTKQL